MPRKALDMSRGVLGCFRRKASQNPVPKQGTGLQGFARICLLTRPERDSCQEQRGINSRYVSTMRYLYFSSFFRFLINSYSFAALGYPMPSCF